MVKSPFFSVQITACIRHLMHLTLTTMRLNASLLDMTLTNNGAEKKKKKKKASWFDFYFIYVLYRILEAVRASACLHLSPKNFIIFG